MGFFELNEGYPWDQVAPYKQRAKEHPGGIVDLSIGTPVDETPAFIQEALRSHTDAHGYPTAAGTPALREAIADWFMRTRGVSELATDAVLPTVGSKEMVALLPSLLGLGEGDTVVVPTIAYPTYDVGARLAGAKVTFSDDPAQWVQDESVKLVWLNSPSNPTGAVLGAEKMREVVRAARSRGIVVASDECYAQLGWVYPWVSRAIPCLLADEVSGGDHSGLISLYSLSKQSSLAGYRAAFAAGDSELIQRILLQRRHMGLMVPAPIQTATAAALGDDDHVRQQREVYHNRRQILSDALVGAGYAIDHSEAGLYLWTRLEGRESDCWQMVSHFADLGILVGPGEFYGADSGDHVRISLTATDERIAAAAARISQQ